MKYRFFIDGSHALGSANASGPVTSTFSFTSDFLDFSAVTAIDRAISLSAVTNAFSQHTGNNKALNSFRSTNSGAFSSEPAPVNNFTAAVPDASTWMMMIAGFGLVGFSARRRKLHVSA